MPITLTVRWSASLVCEGGVSERVLAVCGGVSVACVSMSA